MLPPLDLDADHLAPLLLSLRHNARIFDEPFRRFNRRSLIALCALTLALFGLVLVERRSVQCGPMVDCGWEIIGWLMLLAFLVAVPLDLLCLAASATVFVEMVQRGEWDLLYLTEQLEAGIVDSRYTLALARIWRPLALATNLRIAAVVCWMVWLFVLNFVPALLIAIPVMLAILTPFMMELRWRARALVAAGLAISARIRHPASALLAAMFLLIGFWMVQIGILASVLWALTQGIMAALILPVIYLISVLVLIAAYRALQKHALADATQRMTCCADELR